MGAGGRGSVRAVQEIAVYPGIQQRHTIVLGNVVEERYDHWMLNRFVKDNGALETLLSPWCEPRLEEVTLTGDLNPVGHALGALSVEHSEHLGHLAERVGRPFGRCRS